MLGYKLPVTLLYNTASGMKKYMEENNAPNTGYCWGFEIEFVDETHILFHVPWVEVVRNVPACNEKGDVKVGDLALFLNEASGISFEYTPRDWMDVTKLGKVDVIDVSYTSVIFDPSKL